MKNYQNYIPTFSKAWWENIWYYYKWHIIIGLVVLFGVIVFIVDMFGEPKADFAMMYAGNIEGMGSVEGYALEDRFKPITSDVDGDGKHFVKSNVIYIDEKEKNSVESAMGIVLDSELIAGETTVFFISDYLLGRFPHDEMYDLSAFVEKYNIDESLVLRNESGSAYAVSLSKNPIFTQMDGVVPTNLYLLLRPLREGVDNSIYKENLHKNGVEMAEHILSGGAYIPPQIDYKLE